MKESKKIAYAALCLALAVCVQNLRLVVPLPPFVSMFFIGSLVNMLLLLSARTAGAKYSVLMGFILAAVAFMQGQLPLIFLLPAVGAANGLFAYLGSRFWQSRLIWLVPFVKAAFLWGAMLIILKIAALPESKAAALTLMMSWPQLVTGLLGVAIAKFVLKRTAAYQP